MEAHGSDLPGKALHKNSSLTLARSWFGQRSIPKSLHPVGLRKKIKSTRDHNQYRAPAKAGNLACVHPKSFLEEEGNAQTLIAYKAFFAPSRNPYRRIFFHAKILARRLPCTIEER